MENLANNLKPKIITDDKGHKKVILDFEKYQEFLEDYQDLLAMLEAKNDPDPPMTLKELEGKLKADGIL